MQSDRVDGKSGKRQKRRPSHLPTSALLEFIAPPTGWEIERAICATYSAQCSVLVAMLLAMRGYSNDGDASTVALAKTLTGLRGRVHFLAQNGRVAAPSRKRPILAMLDRFIVSVNYDERAGGQSWHPKACVMKYRRKPQGTANEGVKKGNTTLWRIWIGSRNFTSDNSWDMALSLSSSPNGASGQKIDGVEKLVKDLAHQSPQSESWKRDLSALKNVLWEVPDGLHVRSIRLMLPEDKGRGFPAVPPGTDRTLAVSPFLDAHGMSYLMEMPQTVRRTLISVGEQISGATKGRPQIEETIQVQCLPGPTSIDFDSDMNASVAPDDEPEPRGLHAKFLWFQHQGGASLHLGSSNLTQRGFVRNAEVQAIIDVGKRDSSVAAATLYHGIQKFEDMCEVYDFNEAQEKEERDEIALALENIRKELAANFKGSQYILAGDTVVVRPSSKLNGIQGMSLHIGRIGATNVKWTQGDVEITLPSAPVEENSDLLQLTLSMDSQRISWLQAVPFDPPLDERTRDLPLLRAFLGASGLLTWLADAFSVTGNAGGERSKWDEGDTKKPGLVDPLGISVEAGLAAWARDPEIILRTNTIVDMAKGLLESHEVAHELKEQLQAFVRSWTPIEKVLGSRIAA